LLPATRRPPELQPLELRDETERLLFRCVPTLQLLVCHPPPGTSSMIWLMATKGLFFLVKTHLLGG
jgi:hypothetical protein